MSTIYPFSFVLFAIALFIVNLKVANRYANFINFLFMTLALALSMLGFEKVDEGTKLVSSLILFSAFHFVVSNFLKSSWSKYFAFLSTFIFVIFLNKSFIFQTYPLVFNMKNVLILPILGSLFPIILGLKAKFLNKWYPELELNASLNYLGLGFLILISLFFGSTFGLFLVGIGMYAVELYMNQHREQKSYDSNTLISLGLLLFLVKHSEIPLETLVHQSVLFGAFIGAAIGMLIAHYADISSEKYIKKIMLFIICSALIFLVVFIELFKEHLGGISAFTGFMLAFLISKKHHNSNFNVSIIALSFGILLHAIPALKPQVVNTIVNNKFSEFDDESEEEEENTAVETGKTPEKTDTLTEKVTEEEVKFMGDWKINSKSSKIDFELGPDDSRTKGFFKTVNGDFTMTDNITDSKVNVSIPMNGFSTFNSYRDEGLMGEEYFEANKYPNITFKSVSFKEKGKKYVVKGEVSMKGVKQSIQLELKVLKTGKDAKGEFALVKGKSSLDRTKHNMASDPKIGDLVDFTFQLELRKK